MEGIVREIVAAAPSIRRLELRVLGYDLCDGREYAFSISGLEPRHIGDEALASDLGKLVHLAQRLSICIQTEVDVENDQVGWPTDLPVLTTEESEEMRSWLEDSGFLELGPTQLGLGMCMGVDNRP